MTALTVILAVGIGSYLLRMSMFVALGTRTESLTVPLSMVAPAAVGALVASMALTDSGSVVPLPPAELAAIVAGFAAVRRTDNVMHAFTVGLPVLWLLRAFGF